MMTSTDHVERLRRLLDTHTHHQPTPSSANSPGRPELTAATVGSVVVLPEGTVLWQHATRSSRELFRVVYDGGPLVVHNVEPAGASFLAGADNPDAKVRRGPAVTLRAPEADGEELFVLFAADLG